MYCPQEISRKKLPTLLQFSSVAQRGKKSQPPFSYKDANTVLYSQIETHGQFWSQYFDNDGKKRQIKEFEQLYEPNGGLTTKNEDKLTHFNRKVKERGRQEVEEFQPSNAMEHFIQMVLLDKSYSNTTIIGSGDFITYVLQTLRKMQVSIRSPSRHRNSNKIIRLSLPWPSIIFCVIEEYLQDWKSFSDVGITRFFPMVLNHKGSIYQQQLHQYLYSNQTDVFRLLQHHGYPQQGIFFFFA